MKKTRENDQGRVFDSLTAASSALGIPLGILKAAKRQGCPAFKGGRVIEAGLREWLDQNPDTVTDEQETLEGLKKQFLKTQIAKGLGSVKLLDVQIKRESRDLISREEFEEQIRSGMAAVVEIAKRHLSVEAYGVLCREVKRALGDLAKKMEERG